MAGTRKGKGEGKIAISLFLPLSSACHAGYLASLTYKFYNMCDKKRNKCLSVTVSRPSLSPHRLSLRYVQRRRLDRLPTAVNRGIKRCLNFLKTALSKED